MHPFYKLVFEMPLNTKMESFCKQAGDPVPIKRMADKTGQKISWKRKRVRKNKLGILNQKHASPNCGSELPRLRYPRQQIMYYSTMYKKSENKKKLLLQQHYFNNTLDWKKKGLQWVHNINPTIHNIIRWCWFARLMEQTTRQPSVWCSKYFFFIISYRLRGLKTL